MEQQIGDYRLDHLIGQGSAGEVWLAWEQGALGRPVAVKRVRTGGDPETTRALAAEARLLAGIHHPHLVPVVSVVSDGEGLAIVMPYLAGGSLAALLEERGTLGPGEVVALLEPLADAVGALDRRGIVHGDLKPGNVMLTGDGEPVLVDAGSARAGPSPKTGPRVAGTPEYLDPAVAQGDEPGARSEVYSLGVLAYECLTGRVPHRGEPAEVLAVAGAGVHRRLHSWPTVPAVVADVVESALDPHPARRPADAARFAAELRSAVAAHAVEHDRPHPIELPGITRRALAAPVVASGSHTVVVDVAPTNVQDTVHAPRRSWMRPAVAGVAALVVVALITLASGRPPGEASVDGASVQPALASSRVHEPECEPRPQPHPPASPLVVAEASALVADIDGDGCADLARWDGHHLTVTSASGTRTYRLGRPGDQVLFGDWDGDGAATPALYRPATGEVLYVDRFPAEIGDRETAVRVEHLDTHGTALVQSAGGTGRGALDRVVLADGP